MIPVSAQHPDLNSVPNGSGFRKMKDMFGNPPVLFFLGRQADMDSSCSLQYDAATFSFLFALNCATNFDITNQGS
jgi:hypothetical protein